MPQDYTTSDARGNASARATVSTSAQSDTQTFRKYLEAGEIDLHFQYNVEILALAEQIGDAESEAAYYNDPSNFAMDPDGAIAAAGRGQNLSKSLDKDIAKIEALIEAEIAEAKAEFHDLADALTRGRTAYRAATSVVGVGFRPSQAQVEGFDTTNPLTGEEMRAAGTVEDYEMMLRQYELIKLGFAHNTTAEIVRALSEEIAIGLVTDVATAGAARFFKVGKLLAAVRMSKPAVAIASRFKKLSSRAKQILERVRGRVRKPEASTRGPDGKTIEGKAAKPGKPNCHGVVCVRG